MQPTAPSQALAAARPMLVGVVPAASLVPHLAAGGACHAGPPIASPAMCAPMRAALGVALTIEGVAPTPAESLALADAGEVPLRTNHDCGGVGPMSGVVTGSMPVLVARDEATGLEAWCPLNEGSGKVLRYGADDDEVVARLLWMRDVLAPELARALEAHGPLSLLELHAASLLSAATRRTTARRRARRSSPMRWRRWTWRSTRSSAATASSSSTSRWCSPSSRWCAPRGFRGRRS